MADDIIMKTDTIEDMECLQEVLHNWCKDFRMTISPSKTQVVGANRGQAYVITGRCPNGQEGNLDQFSY